MEPILIGIILMWALATLAINLAKPKRAPTRDLQPLTHEERMHIDTLIATYVALSDEHARRYFAWEIRCLNENPPLREHKEHEAALLAINEHMRDIDEHLTLHGRVAPPCA